MQLPVTSYVTSPQSYCSPQRPVLRHPQSVPPSMSDTQFQDHTKLEVSSFYITKLEEISYDVCCSFARKISEECRLLKMLRRVALVRTDVSEKVAPPSPG
jgi:hypothetical protein